MNTDSKQDEALRKLTHAELNHLVALLEVERESGSYAGPREQYYARTDRLIAWCRQQMPAPQPEHCDYCKTEHVPNDGSCERERLRRRRAFMPDYDKKLEEWLS